MAMIPLLSMVSTLKTLANFIVHVVSGDKRRFVTVQNVYLKNPSTSAVTVNQKYGDEATLSNIYVDMEDVTHICPWSVGSEDGEPDMVGEGISPPLCNYAESDIHLNEGGGSVATATSTASASSTTTIESTPAPKATESSVASSSDTSNGTNEEDEVTEALVEEENTSEVLKDSAATEEETNEDVGEDATELPATFPTTSSSTNCRRKQRN